MNYEEFRDSIKAVNKSRVHKITNSITTCEVYKTLKNNGYKSIGYPIKAKLFYAIIKQVNKLLAEDLLKGNEIKLPANMGTIELRKYASKVGIVNGKLVTNLPIDWNATLKLWYEDEQSRNDKTLVRLESKEIFKVFYNKKNAKYNNKAYYLFRATRSIKNLLTKLIKDNNIDAYLEDNYG